MKRAPFLGAAATFALTACGGGRHLMQALPGVAPNSRSGSSPSSAADPIPANVLEHPIIGEARRFDGDVAPPGWLLMRGATLSLTGYQMLFRILGTSGGGDGRSNFKLPAPKQGWIIAVAGTFPTSPNVLAQLGRDVSPKASLGAGAVVVRRTLSGPAQQRADRRAAALLENQRQVRSFLVARAGRAIPPSPELVARRASAREDARTAALAALSTQNRERALALVDAVLGGMRVVDATRRMAASLTAGEGAAVLDVFDANLRTFGGSPSQHADAVGEAARYVVEVAFSAQQLRELRAMQRDD